MLLAPAASHAAGPTTVVPASATSRWRDASFDDYREHLGELNSIVQACARARDLKTCDPTLVGPDDRVPFASGSLKVRRLVRYGWLRVLLSRAEDKDTVPEPSTKETSAVESAQPAAPTTSQLLQDAEKRLQQDLAQAKGPPQASSDAGNAPTRAVLKQVLAGREFRDLEDPTARDSALEKLGNWFNRLFDSAARLSARSAWVGRLIVWGFFVLVCLGLAWALLQMERRGRIRLNREAEASPAESPSLRGWQLWLGEASASAAAGQWREAIHFVYWASIARIESRGRWPTDRARTPREYLALAGAENPHRDKLATLTRAFERTWYGGRTASEQEYREAEQAAAELIAGGEPAGGGRE